MCDPTYMTFWKRPNYSNYSNREHTSGHQRFAVNSKGGFFVCLFVWSDRCGCLDYCSGYTNSYVTKTHTTVLYSMLILKLQLKSLGLPKALKKWCFRIVVLEKTLEGPLDSKEIKQVNPKGNQPWIFIGRTDAKAVAPILWSPDAKFSQLIGKDPDAGKNWRQEEKRATEDEMVGWHHWLKRHEFEQILVGMVKDREVWHLQFMQSQRAGHNLATEQQGYSLVVQWLRLHGPNAGGPGLIPNQGDRSHMQLKITWATRKIKDRTCCKKTLLQSINKYIFF